jgi:hypothetical protein
MSGPGLALLVALVVTLQTGTSMAAGDATPGRASALERHALGLDGTDDLLANMTLLEPLPPDRGDWRNRATRTRPQDVSQPGGGERQ